MLAYLLLSSCSFALPIPKTSNCKRVRGHEVQGHASAHVQTSSSDKPISALFCLKANNEVSVRIERPKDYDNGELTFGHQRPKVLGNRNMKCKGKKFLGIRFNFFGARLGKTICSIKVAIDTEAKYVLTYNSKSRIRDVEFVWNPETAQPSDTYAGAWNKSPPVDPRIIDWRAPKEPPKPADPLADTFGHTV
jgi:hypothetical protein